MITAEQLLLMVFGYFLLGIGLTMTFGMHHPWGFVVVMFGMLFGVLGALVLKARPYRESFESIRRALK
jgi:hypothetical protein